MPGVECFSEWEVALERPLRLPGKAQLDRRLDAGRLGISVRPSDTRSGPNVRDLLVAKRYSEGAEGAGRRDR
jgi:hypothetical protein